MSTITADDRLAARFIREWLFLAAALLMLGGGVGWSLYADHRELEDEERERLSRRANMIDENIGHQLFAINRALESIRRDLPTLKMQKDSTGLINDRLQALTEVMPGVRTLLVYDADATVLASNRKELIGRNFSEQEYVKVALQTRNPAMFHLSAPYTTTLGAFAMTAVKLIADDRGGVVGMVGATITPEYFKTLLHSVLYAPDMRASLVHSEGSLFAIMPELAGTQGADVVKPGSFFTRHRDSGQQETLLTGISSVTGDERMMALRTVKPANLAMDKTLVVSVGRDLPAIFAVWRRDAYEKAALFGLISLITTGGLFLIQRRQRAYARVVAHDAVERQKAEASQRKSESLFRNYFTLGQVGMAITSVDKGWLDVNGRLCEMLGYPKEELLKKTWLELTHPDDVEPDMVQFNRLLSGQIERYAMDKRFMHKNGSIVHTHLTVACQRNPDKSVEYVIASLQDITERKQAENALRESRELLVYAFNKSPLMNTLSDLATGKYLEVNDSFCRTSGYSREEVIGKTAIELGWIGKDERMRMMQEVQQAGWVSGMELSLRSKNGQNIIGRYWGTVIHSTQGDKLFSAAEDITERKQAEARSHEGENRRISEQAAALEAQRQAGLATLNLMEDAIAARTRAEAMTATLDKQLDELRRWQQVTLGREGRVLAMKKEVNSLLAELGQPPRYPSAAEAEPGK